MKKIILTLLVSMTALFLGSVRSSAAPAMSEASDTVTVVKATGGPKTIVLVNPGENKVKVIKMARVFFSFNKSKFVSYCFFIWSIHLLT